MGYLRPADHRALITAKKKQYPKRYSEAYMETLRGFVGKGYHAWDYVGLIKGILWGWNGSKNVPYGVNGVPDTNTVGMRSRCTHRSTDFNKIITAACSTKPVTLSIYIGDGLAVEATSAGFKSHDHSSCKYR